MSLKKVEDEQLKKLFKLIAKGDKAAIKQLIKDLFIESLGRYHNSNETLYFEIFTRNGDYIWRQGNIEYGTNEKEEILDFESAVKKFSSTVPKGYQAVVKAPTEELLSEGLKKLESEYSSIRKEGKLGTYRKGIAWTRINEYETGIFHVEAGFGHVTTSFVERTEDQIRKLLVDLQRIGYKKDNK